MKTTVKTTLTVIVLGSMLVAVVPANADDIYVKDTSGLGTQGTYIHLQGQDESAKTYDLDGMASVTQLNSVASHVSNLDADLNSTKNGVLIVQSEVVQNATDIQANKDAITQNKADQDQVNNALLNQNIQQDAKITDNSDRITTLENAPKPTNGVDGKDGATGTAGANGKDGKDGANGVTTTITQVDTATQAKVAANTAAISSTSNQAAGVAQDLQDAKKVFNQQQANTNAQFKSLRDEVDSNKKEARSGAASAIAIASMPQVEASQNVMFSAGVGSFKDEQAVSVGASFHAGAATVKTGVSTSTNNDFALGAGVGFGF